MQPLFGGCPRHLIDIDKTAPQRYVYRRGATTLSRNPVRHSQWPAEIKKAATFQRLLCDPGEARTLDPMIKSHLLYQLSYGVNVLLISVAKVMPFFYPTKFSGCFFQKKLGQECQHSIRQQHIFSPQKSPKREKKRDQAISARSRLFMVCNCDR